MVAHGLLSITRCSRGGVPTLAWRALTGSHAATASRLAPPQRRGLQVLAFKDPEGAPAAKTVSINKQASFASSAAPARS